MHPLPLKVSAILRDFEPNWFVAGGWAIDLFLGKVTRPHQDIEVAIFRRDQSALQDYLGDWRWQKVVNGERSIWHRDEWLKLPVHELDCFNARAEPQHLEVVLNESNGNEWVYRRNEKVRRSIEKCQHASTGGVKFLCPEIVLLYKSKDPRAKDERDFLAVVKHLDLEPKRWLRDAIAACDPGHRWLQCF